MKKVVKNLYRMFFYIKWIFEYYIIRLSSKSNNYNENDVPMGKTLIIVPHADDELFGTFGFISNNKEAELYYMEFTGSNPEEYNKEIRKKEFVLCCENLGVNYYFFNQHPLPLLLEKKYKNILLPSLIDWHDEHRLCNKILLDNLSKMTYDIPNIYWYSVSVPIMSQNKNNIFVPINKRLQSYKYNLFKHIYISQKNMPIKRFAMQERINAIGTPNYACEILHMITYSDLQINVLKLEDEQFIVKLNDLKKQISNLKLIRELSKELYSILDD